MNQITERAPKEIPAFAWAKVADSVRQNIEAGLRKPGSMIPSEAELCRQFRVSRITVRAAVQSLVRDGFLTKQHGRGTFVRQRKTQSHLHFGFLLLGDDLTNPIYAAVLRGAENAAIEHEAILHYQKIPCSPRSSLRRQEGPVEARMIRRMVEEDAVQGFQILGWIDEPVIEVLRALKSPVVMLGSHQLPDDMPAWWDQVDVDDVEVGRMIGKYLADLGHRRVVAPAVQPPLRTTQCILKGLRKSLGSEGATVIPCEWGNGFQPIDIEKAVLRAFRATPRAEWPTAILCADGVALAVMRAARSLGLAIPRDLSVVGLGDLRLNENYDPPLTSARLFPEEIGRAGFRLLTSRIQGAMSPRDPVLTLMPPELVIRDSTGKPPPTL